LKTNFEIQYLFDTFNTVWELCNIISQLIIWDLSPSADNTGNTKYV